MIRSSFRSVMLVGSPAVMMPIGATMRVNSGIVRSFSKFRNHIVPDVVIDLIEGHCITGDKKLYQSALTMAHSFKSPTS